MSDTPENIAESTSSTSATPKKRKPGRPAAGDKAISQTDLLEAALHAFAEHGYEGVSIRKLTRDLGVSHNLIHHYFSSKEQLWRSALEYGNQKIPVTSTSLLSSEIAPGEEIERLYDATYTIALMAAEHSDYFKIIMDEASIGGERFDFLYDNFVGGVADAVNELFQRAIKRGEARDLPPGLTSIMLLAVIGTPFTMKALARKLIGADEGRGLSKEEAARAVADSLFYGVKV
ncbi:MAG: TetR/AcrR family transcriptional regulator [Parvibaculaceae bacterium]|nr:TetR/AcrR family transcriptional regulator [Parvibaculaceae bacterium]